MRFFLDLFRPSLRMTAVGLCAAGILHLCIALASPHLQDSPAYRTVVKDLPLNAFKVLPPITSGTQMLPFMGPDARFAACRFDSTGGTVSASAYLPGPGWVLSIFSPAGDNVYSAVAQPSRGLDVQLRIIPLDDKLADIAPTTRVAALRDDQSLTIPIEKGVLLIRAPDQGSAYQARNVAGLEKARCSFTARPRS